jgi:hypothetical protein
MTRKTQAKCIGHNLTVGFHSAHPPLIWRFDLERNHSFTLSLQGEEGDWELGITSPKGDFYGVAHFATRDDAEEALLTVEKTLSRRKGGSSILKALLAVVVAVIVVVGAVALFATFISHSARPVVSTAIMPSAAPAPVVQDGIPLPADEVLKPPAP